MINGLHIGAHFCAHNGTLPNSRARYEAYYASALSEGGVFGTFGASDGAGFVRCEAWVN